MKRDKYRVQRRDGLPRKLTLLRSWHHPIDIGYTYVQTLCTKERLEMNSLCNIAMNENFTWSGTSDNRLGNPRIGTPYPEDLNHSNREPLIPNNSQNDERTLGDWPLAASLKNWGSA